MTESFERYYQAENPEERTRFTRAPRGQTEQINFRIYTFHARTLDEIIQSAHDPSLKTKSDCLQDAVSFWIDEWNKKNQDGVKGRTLRRLNMERMLNLTRERESFIDNAKEVLEVSKLHGDRNTLYELIDNMEGEIESEAGHAPVSYIDLLKKVVNEAQRFLDGKD